MFFQVSSLFSVSPFFYFFSFSFFVSSFLDSSILITFLFNSQKIYLCFSVALFLSSSSPFILVFHHLLLSLTSPSQFDPFFQCLLSHMASFLNFSFLTFYAHMFISSLSFFLFHRFSFLFLLFFSCLLLPLFLENYVFILCPCRDAEAFSLHLKEKNLMESPRERCEERDRMCSENCIV